MKQAGLSDQWCNRHVFIEMDGAERQACGLFGRDEHCQQDDGSRQCQQNGLPGDGSVIEPTWKMGLRNQPARNAPMTATTMLINRFERSSHDLSGDPADHCGYDQVNN